MKKNNFTYRKACASDDVTAIAKYVYMTDPFIYPNMCDDYADPFFIRLISHCIKEKTNLFYYDNIFVALHNEKIIGVLCGVCCGTKLTFIENLNLSDKEHRRLELTNNGYFIPLINESLSLSGYNITNVCIDSDFRHQGIGENLVNFYLSQIPKEIVHLDVIADNLSAIRLYKRCGFEIESKYYGFSGKEENLLCYHMVKK